MSQCDSIYHPAAAFQAFLPDTGQNIDSSVFCTADRLHFNTSVWISTTSHCDRWHFPWLKKLNSISALGDTVYFLKIIPERWAGVCTLSSLSACRRTHPVYLPGDAHLQLQMLQYINANMKLLSQGGLGGAQLEAQAQWSDQSFASLADVERFLS